VDGAHGSEAISSSDRVMAGEWGRSSAAIGMVDLDCPKKDSLRYCLSLAPCRNRAICYDSAVMERESLEIKDWSPLFANYRGQWVALAGSGIDRKRRAYRERVEGRTFADPVSRTRFARYFRRL
jgi:hypothetical protein